jgi:hypothetical protein
MVVLVVYLLGVIKWLIPQVYGWAPPQELKDLKEPKVIKGLKVIKEPKVIKGLKERLGLKVHKEDKELKE